MKKLSSKIQVALLATAGALLFTGCASTTGDYSALDGPQSQLAFTPVTDPEELVKWSSLSGHRVAPQLFSVDTYYLTVPVDQDLEPADIPARESTFRADLEPESIYTEPAGAESREYRTIRHTPNQR